jgi:hypothetical protein
MFMRKNRAWARKNGDFIAIAVLSGMLTALIYIVAASSNAPHPAKPFNFGFSPALNCELVGIGEPVCTPKYRP